MKEKKIFREYGCFSVSRYIKGGKKSHLETQLNFQTDMWHKRIVLVEGFMRNQEGIKIELQIRVHRRVYVRDMTSTMGGNLCDDIMSEQLKI